MANVGTIYYSQFPEPYDISERSDLAVAIRKPAFTIEGHENHEVLPGWGNASRSLAVLHAERTLNRTVNGWFPGMYDELYNNLIMLPMTVNVGTIAAPRDGELVIWNSGYSTVSVSIAKRNWAGISDDLTESRITLGPLEDRVVHYTVTMSGAMTIDATLTASTSRGGVSFGISGIRGILWPFQPLDGMKEVWEWKTEILKTWDFGESRIALRDIPRFSYEMEYRLHRDQDSQMDLILYEQLHCPISLGLFEQSAAVTSAVPAGAEIIPCDTGFHDWKVGSNGIIWQSPRKAELFTVSNVGQNSLQTEAPLSRPYSSALVMPAEAAYVTGFSRTDDSMPYSDFTVKFRMDGYRPEWSIPESVEQYDGHEVWELDIYDGDRTMDCPKVTLDNGIGPVKVLHAQPVPDAGVKIVAYGDDVDKINILRGRLLRRQGCVVPFWMSSRRLDVIPAGTIFAKSNELPIRGFGTGASLIEGSRRRLVRIEMEDGTVFYRTILAIVRNDDDTDSMTFSEPISETEDIPKDAFRRISFMTLVRLASDRVVWTWHKTGKAEVSFSVVETEN